jgi:DNA-binding MarR family transcriptional regulator
MIKKEVYNGFLKKIFESNLSQTQYRLVLYLLYNSDKSYKIVTNNSSLIEILMATKKTIIEAIKELVSKNIISKNILQNGYELSVIFEQKKEVKKTSAEITTTPIEVAPAESVTKVKKSRKTKHEEPPAEMAPSESVTKVKRPKKRQHEETPAELTTTPTEVSPSEKPKRSRKAKK